CTRRRGGTVPPDAELTADLLALAVVARAVVLRLLLAPTVSGACGRFVVLVGRRGGRGLDRLGRGRRDRGRGRGRRCGQRRGGRGRRNADLRRVRRRFSARH